MDLSVELVGESPALEAVREDLRRLLAGRAGARRLPSILIEGETGTGKGLVARVIHRSGPRAGGPFVDVNCAAIPETLLEAELFGFERGAFTDARRSKAGLFQTAHRGTIFLDEIGLLPEALQAKLLKVIEEHAVRRLGSTASEPVDAWVVSATNSDLRAAIRERRFREDLYHRLAVVTLRLPPLRERGQDIVLLAERFLVKACADYGLPEKRLASDARARLLAYPWPGNIRELFNVIERVALLTEGALVSAEMLALPEAASVAGATDPPAAVSIDEAMRQHLVATLGQTQWNISRAAALLGISRNTLRARIERFGLRADGQAAPPPTRRPATRAPAPLPPPAADPSPSGALIRWEHRRITVLRAVLVRSEQEALTDTGRALELLVDKVRSFGGSVEEMSPRSIGAVFGLEPVEDAPRRAAHTATAIQKAAERSRRGDGEQFAVVIAIHVGDVLVGQSRIGTEIDADAKRAQWAILDGMLVGAEPGRILVSAAAARFLTRRFDLSDQRVAEGSAVYVLSGRERARFGREGRQAWFWGRRQELDLLNARLSSARAGHGQIVGIVGEAGIGKSRLLYEFSRTVREQQLTYLEGHCLSYGASMPYLPILEILRHGCRLTDADRPDTIVRKLGTSLERLGIPADDAVPYLLQFLGVKEGTERLAMVSPDAIRARTFDILRRSCANASRRRPLVLAIEDMHWIDDASEALGALVESLEGLSVLFVMTYRPGYRPPWLDRPHVTQIALQPLSAQESRSLLGGIVSGAALPAPIVQLIVDKAEGNPFFLEELARSVAEASEARPSLAAPQTVQEVLLARINRLPDPAKRLLQAAAVLGREAPRPLLAAVAGAPGDFADSLRELTRQEFLYERDSGEEPVYVFKHVLTQEVAYMSLPDSRRRAHHAAAGEALERQYAGRAHEGAEFLAHHFGSSGDGEKAAEYALLAATKAHRRWANIEALAHFTAALRCLDALPDTPANRLRRIDAIVQQAEVKFALGQHTEHVQALEGIRHLVETTADPPRRAAWYYWTGFLHSLTGSRPEIAIAYCREASAIADAEGLDEIRAYADCCLAQVLLVAGDLRGALEAGQRALGAFEARGNLWWACRTLWQIEQAANALGEWEQSLRLCRRALEYAQTANDLRLKVVGWARLGAAHVQRGDAAAALQCCAEAQELSPAPFDAAMVGATHGYALVKTGHLDEGVTGLEHAVAWFERAQLQYTRLVYTCWLSEAYQRQGRGARARELLEGILTASRELGYPHLEGVAERLLGECLSNEDAAEAARHIEKAMRILHDIGARNDFAKTLVAQAELERKGGSRVRARERLEQALQIFRTLGTLDEPDRVQALLRTL
jgi:transcriptional regulator with AAA-type ATPase domain/tetratricopeptide (TPR) repeat protein